MNVQFNGQKFSVLSEKVSFNPWFFWLKNQKYAFLKKRVLIKVLYQISVQLVIDWSSHFKKHQTLEILTKVDFLNIS